MVFANKKAYRVMTLAFFLLCSCNVDLAVNKNANEAIKISQDKNDFTIRGKTELSDFDGRFNVKANPDYASSATISVIYPNDYHDQSLKEATVATGLSDSIGRFKINPGFTPENNQVMVLESSKRNKGVGYSSVSMRTHIRWNGQKWESISGDNILINKYTTAIAIISSVEPNTLSSSDSINRLSYNGITPLIYYTTSFTNNIYKRYLAQVSIRLSASLDPVRLYNEFSPATDRAYISSVKANMHTLQTAAETYAVDWQGIYAPSLQVLETEAKSRNYWSKFKNPFNTSSDALTLINNSDYISAKTTLKYKGQDIGDMSFFAGVVTYEPVVTSDYYPGSITSYLIYGVDAAGEYIKDIGDRTFVLSNY